jgi:hypothetical protein
MRIILSFSEREIDALARLDPHLDSIMALEASLPEKSYTEKLNRACLWLIIGLLVERRKDLAEQRDIASRN